MLTQREAAELHLLGNSIMKNKTNTHTQKNAWKWFSAIKWDLDTPRQISAASPPLWRKTSNGWGNKPYMCIKQKNVPSILTSRFSTVADNTILFFFFMPSNKCCFWDCWNRLMVCQLISMGKVDLRYAQLWAGFFPPNYSLWDFKIAFYYIVMSIWIRLIPHSKLQAQ